MIVPKKIVWLASYPKSGNTWFRAFLTALLGNDQLDINALKTDGIFSARSIFEHYTDIDSTLLYDEEAKEMLPQVFEQMAILHHRDQPFFIKIHDAYTLLPSGNPLVPTSPTFSALYFIRNPLDVVGSYANHNNYSIQESVTALNDVEGGLSRQRNNAHLNKQFHQLMLDWSGHVESWVTQAPFPVKVIRYEDMLSNSLSVFLEAMKAAGIPTSEEEVRKALELSSFEKLREQEEKNKFREAPRNAPRFFRSGKSGKWREELSREQVQSILTYHEAVMRKFGYWEDSFQQEFLNRP